MDTSTQQQDSDRKRRYKLLLDKTNELQQEINHMLPSETCLAVQDIVQNCNNIHKETSITEKVENTSEIVMDAQLMKNVHESVSKFNCGPIRNLTMAIINALISQNESENWRVITEIALNVARPACIKSSMFGCLDVEPKERVVKNDHSVVKLYCRQRNVQKLLKN
ncbi:hypothetical protein DOY81_014902 [Sarcophaga bullata]|nr:hypothetical protein DOY81_014902 [Sarcophaga bullata]